MKLQIETSNLPLSTSSCDELTLNAVAALTLSEKSESINDIDVGAAANVCQEDCAASSHFTSCSHGFYFDDSLSLASDIVSVEDELDLSCAGSLDDNPIIDESNITDKLRSIIGDRVSAGCEMDINDKPKKESTKSPRITRQNSYRSDCQTQMIPHKMKRESTRQHKKHNRKKRSSKQCSASRYQNARLVHEEVVCKLEEELLSMKKNPRVQGREGKLHPKTTSIRKHFPSAGRSENLGPKPALSAKRDNIANKSSVLRDGYPDRRQQMSRSKSESEMAQPFKSRREMMFASRSARDIVSTREDRNCRRLTKNNSVRIVSRIEDRNNSRLLQRNNSLRKLPSKQSRESGRSSGLQRNNSMKLLLSLFEQPENENERSPESKLSEKQQPLLMKSENEEMLFPRQILVNSETKAKPQEGNHLISHAKDVKDNNETTPTSTNKSRSTTEKGNTTRNFIRPSRSSRSLSSGQHEHKHCKRKTLRRARSVSSSNLLQSMTRHDMNTSDLTKSLQSTKSMWSSDRQVITNKWK